MFWFNPLDVFPLLDLWTAIITIDVRLLILLLFFLTIILYERLTDCPLLRDEQCQFVIYLKGFNLQPTTTITKWRSPLGRWLISVPFRVFVAIACVFDLPSSFRILNEIWSRYQFPAWLSLVISILDTRRRPSNQVSLPVRNILSDSHSTRILKHGVLVEWPLERHLCRFHSSSI